VVVVEERPVAEESLVDEEKPVEQKVLEIQHFPEPQGESQDGIVEMAVETKGQVGERWFQVDRSLRHCRNQMKMCLLRYT
jgi:type II secretory pathway component PulK